MKHILDFRNARYQGDLLNGKPHGLGIMVDFKNIFCLAEWKDGLIHGNCLVVFGDSKIFYGQIADKQPTGICTYHLKDKCQIFCNFTHQNQPLKPTTSQNPSETINMNKLVALLPTFNLIIKVEGQNQQQLEIKSEQSYRQNDFEALQGILQKALNIRFQQGQLQSFLSLQNFIKANFISNPKYVNSLDIVLLSNQDGTKQLFLTLKTLPGQSSLGIRIQNCMENTTTMTNLHNDGNSYIVKSIGFFSKEGLLQYGLKNIKTLIKGNVKEQAIYNDEKTIIRYENEQSRPKQCSQNLLNFFKRSPKFVNQYLPVRHLTQLQAECLNINFSIKQTQTKKYAQLILQNPKEFSMIQKQQIEEARLKKLNTSPHSKNPKLDSSTSSYKRIADDYSKKNEHLEKVKEEIYRSVSKKKTHGGKSTSPYVHGGTNLSNSPQKQLKPAQLTNVKPILDIYKKTPQKSFYHSINNTLPQNNNQSIQGYKFSIPKHIDPSQENKQLHKNTSKTTLKQPSSTVLASTDYFKNLQSRRRLYEQVYPQSKQTVKNPIDALKRPNVTDYGSIQKTPNKKKITYLPEDEQSNLNHSRSRKNVSNPNFAYLDMSQDDPHRQYNRPQERRSPYARQGTTRNPNENYFRSQRLSPHSRITPQKYVYDYDNQVGKLGKRTVYKREPSQRSLIDALDYSDYNNLAYEDDRHSRHNYPRSSPHDPIIVPEFKINKNTSKRPVQQEDYISINPRRQHNLRTKPDNLPSNYIGYNRQSEDRNGYYADKQQSYQASNIRALDNRRRILSSNPFDS